MKVQKIDIDKIEQNENSRVVYKTVDLAELMMSMKKNGLLEPVGVRPLKAGKFEAVFGNRRIVAAKKLGWTDIPAHVLEVDSDIDRDIIGLIENLKRQNTSVAEDGRMFQSLKDRGLSEGEIAARLDITELRVKMALEVINGIPEEFRNKIVYTQPGQTKRPKGKISASTAMAVLNVRKTAGLNRAQTRKIMSYLSDNTLSIDQIHKIAPIVKSGVSIAEAIEKSASMERLLVTVYMYQDDIETLEKKHGRSVNQVLYDYLKSNREFKIQEPAGPGNLGARKTLTAMREKAAATA